MNILDIWHRRLGHINEKYIRILCPFIPKYLSLTFCPYCAVSKLCKTAYNKTKTDIPIDKSSNKKTFRNNINTSKHHDKRKLFKQNKTESVHNISMYSAYKPGEYIVVDLKHMPTSINNEQYLCTFTCLSSRLSESVYLKTRLASEFLEHYKHYCKHIRNKTGRYPKYLHTDNGSEFIDKCTSSFNKEKGITHTFTSSHSSLQNPVAERINRTLGEGCLALLLCAGLPLMFWVYAISFFSFVKARSPHKALNFSNPLTCWNVFNVHRTSIDLYDVRIFGCEAYVLDEYSLKNHPKAFRCIYLGPSSTHKGANFYNLYTKKIFVSRNFILNEQNYPGRVYFPHIYDKYFGTPPPNSQTESNTESETLATAVDADGIPYSILFEFADPHCTYYQHCY